MTKERLKLRYVPLTIFILVMIPIITLVVLFNASLKEKTDVDISKDNEIIESTLPVINTTIKPIVPYTDQTVKIGKTYYDYLAEEASQENAIIKHDNTYIQNTGIDYVGNNIFDVVAILDGTVEKIVEDDSTGKTIEIKHSDNSISIYGSLSEIIVKKGDTVNQGQQIGKSGTNELDKEMGNHLHFEVYNNGQNMNPEVYLNTEQKIKGEE
ncbi:MAG: M23 family metallopeptidase [Bacilli bacterium]|nr:M23 family metallopeptidase [Bacilli bacterium]MBQ6404679.1 M23 family metallopeptidase [Bacilli bacterium]